MALNSCNVDASKIEQHQIVSDYIVEVAEGAQNQAQQVADFSDLVWNSATEEEAMVW